MLSRASEATGERTSYCCVLVGTFTASIQHVGYSEKIIRRLLTEHAVSGMDLSSSAKHYKSSRQKINGFYKSTTFCKSPYL